VVRPNPARLVIALAVASCLAIFLFYTAIAGGGTPSLKPSELARHRGEQVNVTGKVAPPVRENASGARFRLRDIDGKGVVTVVYRDALPDQFKIGRHISLDGRLQRSGVFVGKPDSMVTKCPSKYTDKKT
jgi:cytochrome c-type biogenesis protein CcmE